MTFTVFSDINRNPNVVYNSGSVEVPDEHMVKFTITGLDMVNEPDTTIIYWTVERAESEGGPWHHMVGGSIVGLNGVEPPKPYGTIATNIDNIVGQWVRGSLYFVSAGDQRKRFGVDGRTY